MQRSKAHENRVFADDETGKSRQSTADRCNPRASTCSGNAALNRRSRTPLGNRRQARGGTRTSRGQFAPGESGNPRGQFPPGVSGNPSGRPKGAAGIAARVREHCGDDFGRLVDAWNCLAFGNAAKRRAFFGETVTVTAKDRLAALAEMRDTAIGRPKQMPEHDTLPVKDRSPIVIVVQAPPPGREAEIIPIGKPGSALLP